VLHLKAAAGEPIGSVLRTYLARVRAFSPNARKYLMGIMIYGAATGVYQLLFNFYVLSLGYNEAVLGNLVTARSATTLIVALPVGYLADRIGRKLALIIGQGAVGAAILMMVLFPSLPMFLIMNIVIGFSQSLAAVAMGPFLMENSSELERTYLFSFSSGLRMTAVSIGEWVGGFLPTWIARGSGAQPTSAAAYSGALALVSVGVALSLIPGFLIRQETRRTHPPDPSFTADVHRRGDDYALHECVFPQCAQAFGRVHWDFIRVGLFGHGDWFAVGASPGGTFWKNTGGGGDAGALHSISSAARFFSLVRPGSGGILCAPGSNEHERPGLHHFYHGTRGPRVQSDGGQPFHDGQQFWLGFQPYVKRIFSGALWVRAVFWRNYFVLCRICCDVLCVVLGEEKTSSRRRRGISYAGSTPVNYGSRLISEAGSRLALETTVWPPRISQPL